MALGMLLGRDLCRHKNRIPDGVMDDGFGTDMGHSQSVMRPNGRFRAVGELRRTQSLLSGMRHWRSGQGFVRGAARQEIQASAK